MSDVSMLSPAAPRPGHVPERLVYDFDMFHDPGYVANPHDRILRMITEAPPVFWTPHNGGHWMAVSHEANFKASRDTETFTSQFVTRAQLDALSERLPGKPHIPMATPINLDPPLHGKYRAPLQKVFSPKSVMAMKEDIRAIADRLIDEIIDVGACEFQAAVAEKMPVEVFLTMFGLPLDRADAYRTLVKDHLSTSTGGDPMGMMMKQVAIADIMRDTLIERRDNPRDDIISLLWQTEIDGEPMTLETMEDYSVLLFIAGLDTVVNGMGHGVRHLALNPDLQDHLRANPGLIPEASEEILRRYTFTIPPRMVARDGEWEGVTLKAGERLMLFLPAADLDPKEYPDPERFDLQRENNVHIAFGTGPHRCLGSHLARVELQVLYEQMLAHMPTWRLDPANPPTFHGSHVMGPSTVHILWDAGAKS